VFKEDLIKAIEVWKKLTFTYENDGIFGFKKGDMPELLKPDELERGSIQHVHYITLLVAIDYMREANQLWQAGINTFKDHETKWVFNVTSPNIEDIGLLVKALDKHKISKKYNKDAKIWQRISKSIKEHFNGDMKSFLEVKCQNESEKIYSLMKAIYKKDFPNLTGDKILPLWIRMMEDVCGLKLTGLNRIPLAVDVHIARATIFSGCLIGNGIKTSIPKIMDDINQIWTKVAINLNHENKFIIDEPLWTLSKYGLFVVSVFWTVIKES